MAVLPELFQTSILYLLIRIFRFLGGNLYPLISETSPMLYQNAWNILRQEPPFLIPECVFFLINSYFPIFRG